MELPLHVCVGVFVYMCKGEIVILYSTLLIYLATPII